MKAPKKIRQFSFDSAGVNLASRPLDSAKAIEEDESSLIRELTSNGDYYEPPIKLDFLAKLAHSQVHHEAALQWVTRAMALGYQRGEQNGTTDAEQFRFLPRAELRKFIYDSRWAGNAYMHIQRTGIPGLRRAARLRHLHARITRVCEDGSYCQVLGGKVVSRIAAEDVIHYRAETATNSIYGLPGYLGARRAIRVNTAAHTLRALYYENGMDLGTTILTMYDFVEMAEALTESADATEGQPVTEPPDPEGQFFEAFKKTQGAGAGSGLGYNFQPLFDGDGKPLMSKIQDMVMIVKRGEEFGEDDFEKTVITTGREILLAHGIHAELAGAIFNGSAPASIDHTLRVYHDTVIRPEQDLLAELINGRIPPKWFIGFDHDALPSFRVSAAPAAAQNAS